MHKDYSYDEEDKVHMKLAHQNPVDGFAFQRKLDYSRMRRTETGIYVWKLQAQWQTHEGMSALLRT